MSSLLDNSCGTHQTWFLRILPQKSGTLLGAELLFKIRHQYQHVNRLGRYVLNTRRRPAALNYDVFTRPAPIKKKSQESFAVA
jgi:hypothetical protein